MSERDTEVKALEEELERIKVLLEDVDLKERWKIEIQLKLAKMNLKGFLSDEDNT